MKSEEPENPSSRPAAGVVPPSRRHDVDWLRTLALGLLIVFHIALSFQSWGASSGIPQNDQLLEELVPFISMLAVWRIPLLFLISGMGVCFALRRRNWKQLLLDRTTRILIPFLFGTYVLETVLALTLPRMGWNPEYPLSFGHLWFLLNIYLYVVWLLGLLIYFKDHPDNPALRFLSRVIRWPGGLFLFALPLMVEVLLSRPEFFSLYTDNVHGWLMGLVCFFWGFIFIAAEEVFWPAVKKIRWVALLLAVSIYLVRFQIFALEERFQWLTALESMSWMLAILGFGAISLNRPSRALAYLSKAVYTVYIVHFPVQFTLSHFLLPLSMPAYVKLLLLLVGTFGISLVLYEFVLRRVKWIRPLFGMKLGHA